MILDKDKDNTSFSSFESQMQERIVIQPQQNATYFSEFEEEDARNLTPFFGCALKKYPPNTKHVLNQNQKQNQCLKALNEKLKQQNRILQKEKDFLKHENELLKLENSKLQKEKTHFLLQKKKQEHKDLENQEKYLQLVQELQRLKENFIEVKKIKEGKQKMLEKLKQDIKLIERGKEQERKRRNEGNQWKQQFINLFIDMIGKISLEIDETWSEKKKVQIGWKMTKNILRKAITSGISLPKIVRNNPDMTYLSEFTKNM